MLDTAHYYTMQKRELCTVCPLSSERGTVCTNHSRHLDPHLPVVCACSARRSAQVVLARSSSPLDEPFVAEAVFSPVFSHEADALRGPQGEIVVMLTHATALPGGHGPGGPACTSCVDGSTSSRCTLRPPYGQPPKSGRAFPTMMMYADGKGFSNVSAFSAPVTLFNGTAGTARDGTYGDTNLAGVILANGTFVGIWRECTRPPWGSTVHSVRAESWADPGTYVWSVDPLFVNAAAVHEQGSSPEDPFVWGPDEAGAFHAIFHDRSCSGCGGHAYSTDGARWFYTGLAYGPAVEFTDGTNYTFARRERPHLVFDSDGQPIALTTGVQYGQRDSAYTLLQPLRRDRRPPRTGLIDATTADVGSKGHPPHPGQVEAPVTTTHAVVVVRSFSELDGKPYNVAYTERSLTVGGKPVLLLSGSVHYPRSTPAMWPQIFADMRAAGLNAVDSYVFWNFHVATKLSAPDYSGRGNVTLFLELAAAADLFVIWRIGPYINAEWLNGGFPDWVMVCI